MANKMSKSSNGKCSGSRKTKSGPSAAQLRQDDSIMNTNDSSIVSKRCVSKLYLKNEPDFYEPFVQKFTRRSPLINRGYWLRMHAIEQVVHQFLQEDNGKSKVVVNLGCGYDPLPFQFWHRHASISQNATFVDVDYPQLIGRKRDRMLTNNLLRDSLLKTSLRSAELPVYVRSDRYMAIGCDLRDLETLERTLRAELDVATSSILFVAEVSLTYMPVSGSDSLIRWASTLEDTRFCLLEQYLPQGPDHPFATTMLKHFDKLHTPIHAVKQYPSLAQQSSRFTNAGWQKLMIARNLWDLWSDEAFTAPALRRDLDGIEPFDEWEEFALFSGHYFLVVASNNKLEKQTETAMTDKVDSVDQRINNSGPDSIVLQSWEQGEVSGLTPRRFGAAYTLDEDTVAFHGGQGPQNRLSNIDLLGRIDLSSRNQPCTTPLPHARICHTITPINKTDSLLVGGRGSPAQALADCWLTENGSWRQVEDLTPARFRHSSARLTLKTEDCDIEGVLVFGGKAGDGTVMDEWTLWTAKHGWQKITVDGPRPSGRFGAAMSSGFSADGGGLVIGGVDAEGTVLEEIWEWHVLATTHLQLKFRDRTNDLHNNNAASTYARIGASLVPFANSYVLIGGVSRKGIFSLSDDFLIITPSATKLHIERPAMRLPSTWPLLVGTAVASLSSGEIVISGGGAVCFSMGSYWNEGYFTITLEEKQGAAPWRFIAVQVNDTAPKDSLKPVHKGVKRKGQAKKRHPASLRTAEVPRTRVQSAEEFSQLVAGSKPVVIEGIDIGPCTKLWTIDYLKEKIGPEREVVIHECNSDRMTFKDKNFEYVKRTVGDFLDGISQGSKTYLRSVSSSQPNKHPTKLEDDFPNIASDFQLPDIFSSIRENYHSSPLRISGPVTLWLHYDVLANVLCQIQGSKTLYLYPPSDVKYLSYPPGGSSSNIDVLTSKDPKLRYTHPHIASLKPGDVLFLPPIWSHTATPEDGMSVAVNVFWRNLENGYAAGKDVYGNRDLQAYENGRRDVERIAKAFRNLPTDLSRFYLDRLTMELQEKTDKLGKSDK